MPVLATLPPCADTDEQVGIARIQLTVPLGGVSVTVAEFIDADRTLTAWNLALRLVHACHYTVLFTDGVSIRGNFVRAPKLKTVLPLLRIIGMGLGVGTPARGYGGQCVLADRHGIPLSPVLLDNYALNHHMLHAGSAERARGAAAGAG